MSQQAMHHTLLMLKQQVQPSNLLWQAITSTVSPSALVQVLNLGPLSPTFVESWTRWSYFFQMYHIQLLFGILPMVQLMVIVLAIHIEVCLQN